MSQYDMPNHQDDSKNTGMASLAHILGLLTGIIGPLIMYLLSEDEFVKQNAAKSFTWQLFLTIYGIMSLLLISFFIGLLLIPILGLINVAFCIIAAVKASDGKVWKYPGTVDLLEESEKTREVRHREDGRNNQRHGRTTNQQDKPNRSKKNLSEEELKQMYLDGEISDEEFDKRLEEIQNREFETEFN